MDQGDFLTLEELEAVTRYTVTLPTLGRKIECRRISRSEYLAQIPVLPEEADSWPAGERAKREQAWLRSLPLDEQVQRRMEFNEAMYRVIELATLRPALSRIAARRLGEDATVLCEAILEHSGILAPPAAPPAPAEPAAAEPPGAP